MNALEYSDTLRGTHAGKLYDEFLYAPLGEEFNGMQLSVLSALARQNVDPWQVARQLRSMPRERAIRFLTPLLAHLPAAPAGRPSPEDLAALLIERLPAKRAADAGSQIPDISQSHVHAEQPDSAIDKMWLIIAFALYMLFSQLLFAGLSPGAATGKTASAPPPAAMTALPHRQQSGAGG